VAESRTRAVIRDLCDAYAQRDFERIAALIHDDIAWVIHAPTSIFPFAGSRRGRTAVLEVFAAIGNAYVLESYQPNVMIVDGERAAVMSDASYRQRASGHLLRLRIANFLGLQDGRVIEFREFLNSFEAAEQALGRELLR
jgi:ketosteroid isomerase-like protein